MRSCGTNHLNYRAQPSSMVTEWSQQFDRFRVLLRFMMDIMAPVGVFPSETRFRFPGDSGSSSCVTPDRSMLPPSGEDVGVALVELGFWPAQKLGSPRGSRARTAKVHQVGWQQLFATRAVEEGSRAICVWQIYGRIASREVTVNRQGGTHTC